MFKKFLIMIICVGLFACKGNSTKIDGSYYSTDHEYTLQFDSSDETVVHSKMGVQGSYTVSGDEVTLVFTYIGTPYVMEGTIVGDDIVFTDSRLGGTWSKN